MLAYTYDAHAAGHISFWQENRIYSKDISRGCFIRLKKRKSKYLIQLKTVNYTSTFTP